VRVIVVPYIRGFYMEIKLRRYNEIYIIDISGDMDLYNAHRLKDVVARLIEKGVKELVVNLEKVDYLDSSGVGSLIHVYTQVKQRSLQLRIAHVHGSVEKVIRLTKLIDYFPIVDSVKTALLELSGKGKE
jgi:anti-sigma B factor antagonist